MIKINTGGDIIGKYQVINLREKWNNVVEKEREVKSFVYGNHIEKTYAITGKTSYTNLFELEDGDIILDSEYYDGYYSLVILRRVI